MKLSCDLISHDWRWGATLRPLTVNSNSFFIEAVMNLDVEGVRRSFAEGLAKPTDYIVDSHGNWASWYFVGLVSISNSKVLISAKFLGRDLAPVEIVTGYASMLRLMADDGLPGRERLISRVLDDIRLTRLGTQEGLRHCLQVLSSHADVFWSGDSILITIIRQDEMFPVEWLQKIFFDTSGPWRVDDLSSLQVCLIGILAHEDPVISGRLKKDLASYRSDASSGRARFVEDLFEDTFGIASVERHFQSLSRDGMYYFLSWLCKTGSVSMVKIFMDFGIDFNEFPRKQNLLGIAAAYGHVNIVYMLLEAGAHSFSSISAFLVSSFFLSDAVLQQILQLLVENARPMFIDEPRHDPLLSIIRSSRAIRCYPEVLEHILDRNLLSTRHLGDDAEPISVWNSYMFSAISRKSPAVVDFLLRNGAHANVRISRSFDCEEFRFGSCTWITLSVMCGAASCTDVLIKHGADVTALDGAGISVLQLAKKNALDSHPRRLDPWTFDRQAFTAEEDAETLAVVERAFNQKHMGTKSLEDYYSHATGELAPQKSSRRQKALLTLEKTVKRALGTFLTPTQIESLRTRLYDRCYYFQRIWSLSFHQALLLRVLYILSYALLLAIELHAFIRGHKRIPMPSRSHISALAVLALALMWGASQLGVSWGSPVAETKAGLNNGDSDRG